MNLRLRLSYRIVIGFIALPFFLQAQTDFGSINVINKTEQNAPTSIANADINGDGHLDILVSSAIDNKIAWYENLNGTGLFSTPIVIFENSFSIDIVELMDVDNDGHLDIIIPSNQEDAIFWLRNRGNASSFSSPKAVNYLILNPLESIVSDIDNDGLEDIITITEGEGNGSIVWQQNLGGSFGTAQLISNTLDNAAEVQTADLDGDGDEDILISELGADKLSYFLNLDGLGDFGNAVTIDQGIEDVLSFITLDLDNNGSLDIITSSFTGGDIFFYKSTGNLNYSKRFLNGNVDGAFDIISFDRNGDSDQDLFLTQVGENKIVFLDNLGNESFGSPITINDNVLFPFELDHGDFDGNGNLDLSAISFFDDKITTYKNDGTNFQTEVRLSTTISGIKDVIKADMDLDGLLDLITISTDVSMISWYKNLGTEIGYASPQIITGDARLPLCFDVKDMNSDGLLDVVYGGFTNNHLSWVRNLGNGIFANPVQLELLDGTPTAISAADMNDDGEPDIAIAMEDQDKVVWLEQVISGVNANPTWTNLRTLINNSGEVTDLQHFDLDEDGDQDLVIAQLDEDRIVWQENINNNINFSIPRIIIQNIDGPRSFKFDDLDGDSIDDLVIAATFDGNVVYLPRNGNTASFGVAQILDIDARGVLDISLSDFDDDTRMDIAYASGIDENVKIIFNKASGFSTPEIIRSDIAGASYISSSDIENDNDQDIVLVTLGVEELLWIENLTNNNCFANDFEISTSECIDDSFSIVLNSFTNSVNLTLGFSVLESTPDAINIDGDEITFGVFDVNTSPTWHVDVIDDQLNNCGNTYEIFSPLCRSSCNLSDLDLTVSTCNADGTTFALNIDMDTSIVSSDGFDVLIDGSFFDFYLYSELPLVIPNFPSNIAGSTTVTICDDDNPNCCISQEVATPCQCNYVNLEYEITSCDTLTNEFYISFDFLPVMTSGLGVLIGGNETTYGTFSEDMLPIEIGPLAADNTFYDFAFFDSGNSANCLSFISVGVIDCSLIEIVPDSCELSNLVLSPTVCNSQGEYFIDISFDVDNPGSMGFNVTDQNGTNYGNYDYNTMVQIGPLTGDCLNIPEIIITDNEDVQCVTSTTLQNTICCTIEECKIENLTVSLGDCTVDDTYTATFDFSVVDPGDQGFTIIGNGQNFGTFFYANLPLSLGGLSSDCAVLPQFTVQDIEDPSCEASFTFLEPKCCLPVCEFSDFSVIANCSLTGLGTLEIDITTGSDLGLNFELVIDGKVIDSYSYSDLPIIISHDIGLIDSTNFLILDEDTGCTFEDNILLDCSNCILEIVDVQVEACQDDNTFSAAIEIASVGLNTNGYDLSINGVNTGNFNVINDILTISGITGDCTTLYSFEIESTDIASCTSSFTLNDPVCCIDCLIENLTFDFIDCSGIDEANFSLDFNFNDVATDSFELVIDGVLLGIFDYQSLPLSVNSVDLNQSNDNLSISICDKETTCCLSSSIVTPDCGVSTSCSIGGFSSESISCNFATNQFTFDLDFIYVNTPSDSFDLTGNLSNYGRFSYLDLPITIGPLDGDNVTEYEYLVTDIMDPSCTGIYDMGTVDCITNNSVDPELENIEVFGVQGKTVLFENINSTIDRIDFYDYTGRKIHQGYSKVKQDFSEDLNDLSMGIYIIMIQKGDSYKSIKIALF